VEWECQMVAVAARAMTGPREPFETMMIERRELRPTDVLIDISFAGICHSDIHHARADWGHTTFPIVPGHEIAGVISAVGSDVTSFRPGDRAGVGCLVNSCRTCEACLAGDEQYCDEFVLTYNAVDRDGSRTYGGYSEKIVVDEAFVVRIPEQIPLEQAAPLMCAGITLYSPLRYWGVNERKRVGIVGLGGLGHMGVQFSAALGAHTVVLDVAPDKRDDALRLGADEFLLTTDEHTFRRLAGSLDLILSTVPARLDLDAYLGLLGVNGTLVNLGVPAVPLSVLAHSLLRNRRSIAGSSIGGIRETQEMLDFCAASGVAAEVEVVSAGELDEAYERVSAGDVRYRLVLDVSTIEGTEAPAEVGSTPFVSQ
jgi:alcohol dehydrogenase (NADP+)